jgi:hypothetical protein
MRMTPRLLVVSVLALMLSSISAAANLAGRVRDANTNAFLLGATVSLREINREATTDREGGFTFSDVPAGTYTLAVSYLGYNDTTQSVTVSGDASRLLDIAIGGEVVKLGSFVVEGNREGQARALQQKRSANMIMDAVAADAVGKFPDGNAAEALRRVPGVSLEIDQSEGRFVVIRGVDAALNNVTLNGQNVGSPAEQGRRGLAMDSVPADLISRLEVIKAVTPDRDHNAIGGSVNIVTQSAFDRAEPFAFGSLSAGYNDFAGDWVSSAASATRSASIPRRPRTRSTGRRPTDFSGRRRRSRSTTTSSARGWERMSPSSSGRRTVSSSMSGTTTTSSPTRRAGRRPGSTLPSAR